MPFLARKVASREKSSGKSDSGRRREVSRVGGVGRGGGGVTFQSINHLQLRGKDNDDGGRFSQEAAQRVQSQISPGVTEKLIIFYSIFGKVGEKKTFTLPGKSCLVGALSWILFSIL